VQGVVETMRAPKTLPLRSLVLRLSLAMAGVASLGAPSAAQAAPALPPPYCSGQYADDFTSLSAAAREFDHRPEGTFSYCTRSTALYECLSYGSDGTIRRDRKKVVAHGTAFAYRKQAGETLLLTNEHVASWPAITDAVHEVSGVPVGCKRVSDTLTLVDDENDSYAKDDIAVTRVVSDPELDVAVLKARAALQVIPWKIGHSAAIRERNLVEVRGFPLGAFRATNIGKVISAHDHDDFGDWDHDDFVVDALLSKGNSGSPVLGISCTTGEYELLGIYHAGYSEGAAMNVVVGIDQVRDLMATLKRTSHDHDETAVALDDDARALLSDPLLDAGDTFFPVGAQVGAARRASDGRLLLALYAREFPTNGEPTLVIELAQEPAAGRVWFGSPRGLKPVDVRALDADGQTQVEHARAVMRADLVAQLRLRALDRGEPGAKQSEQRRRLAKALARAGQSRGELLQSLADLSERLSPQAGEGGMRFAELGRAPANEGRQAGTPAPTALASSHPVPVGVKP
jgi:S1-C subfamily serine protease